MLFFDLFSKNVFVVKVLCNVRKSSCTIKVDFTFSDLALDLLSDWLLLMTSQPGGGGSETRTVKRTERETHTHTHCVLFFTIIMLLNYYYCRLNRIKLLLFQPDQTNSASSHPFVDYFTITT